MVVADVEAHRRAIAFGPSEDIRLPAGVWFMDNNVVGDASGGDVSLTHQLDFNAIYSVEGFFPRGGGGISDVILEWSPSQDGTGGGVLNFRSALGSINISAEDHMVLRDIMGARALPLSFPTEGRAPLLTARWGVNTNGTLYLFESWGYFWQAEARRLAGGPVRPS